MKTKAQHYRQRVYEERANVEALVRQLEDRKQEIERISKVALELQGQNEEFRSQIFALGTGRGPVHDEEFYTTTLEELKCLIEKEIVKLSKAHANYVFQEGEEEEIVQYVSGIGSYGKNCAEFLKSGKYTIQTLYRNGQWRHPFLRHIVAWFLLEQIFNPFAFGISHEFSEGLKCVDKEALSKGSPPQSVMLTHRTTIRERLDDSPSNWSWGFTIFSGDR